VIYEKQPQQEKDRAVRSDSVVTILAKRMRFDWQRLASIFALLVGCSSAQGWNVNVSICNWDQVRGTFHLMCSVLTMLISLS
jgi:hypothetical protein